MVGKVSLTLIGILALAVLLSAPAMAGKYDDSDSDSDSDNVQVCHVPDGNPLNAHEIWVGAKAANAHLAKHAGDSLGPCPSCPCWTMEQLLAALEWVAADENAYVDFCELYYYPDYYQDGDAYLEFEDYDGNDLYLTVYFDFDEPNYNECRVANYGMDYLGIEDTGGYIDISPEEASLCARMISQICVDLLP